FQLASTLSSMASSSLHQTRFDVFLSFRGEDTRHTFTDHLYTALKRAAIHTFRDNDEIERGRDLEPEIVKAIENSRASIVVLSENYAKSRWCLEELTLILELKRKGKHFVLPVFYHVDPSDVRNQRQSFAIEGSKWTEENVNLWKSALREVANLTGMVASGPETEFIADIVDTIEYELDLKLISTPAHLTGMESRAEDINSWLENEHSTTNVLAICGMGGIGKTTLAQYVYNLNKLNFENSCFLEDVGKHFKQTYGLLELQKQLLTNITGGKNIALSCVSEGTTKIKEALHIKKVLIVLDDVNEHDELSALIGTSVIHSKSKVILTTRLLDLHSWFESVCWRCHVHELKLLNYDESLEVFSCHAFGSKHPLEGFSDLAIEFALHCGGNPLALKVLGSSLFGSAEDPRERNSTIEIWRSRLNSLSSMKGDLDSKIQCVLQKSFDSLPLVSYKELFLDIVVFFVGEDKDYVVNILEHDWHAKAGIMALINRCLITVLPNKKLAMHQLLQDMGRSIVREESKDPTKRTRVWFSDEAYQLLTIGDGSKTIAGLTLDARTLTKGTKASVIKTSSISKMHKLKLLQLKYVKLKGHYKNFPELRWLCWHGCHLKAIPSGLLMSSFLVAIDMTEGKLEMFEPPTVINSLKILNLQICENLVSIRKLYRLPNLETLILWGCSDLTHVCETLKGLQNLTLLNLSGCENLWKESWIRKLVNQHKMLKALCVGGGIPEQSFFSLPQSLKFLFLAEFNLKYHNDLRVIVNGPLYGLNLGRNLFDQLPNNIDLKMLRVLNLNSCKNLKSILCLPNTLEELHTYKCRLLEKVTFQSTRFRLKKFDYRGCFNLCEVYGLFKLVAIEELDEADLGHMKWIKAYQDHTVNLICGDIHDEGIIRHIQMLYEYGIRSTYLQGTKDQSMLTHEYTSSSSYLSFCVSSHPKKHKIHGLNVSCLYRLSGSVAKDRWCLFIRIENKTKGVTWLYNPMVYCKPIVDEATMWLSYWPIGYILEVGDKVKVSVRVEEGMIASLCGASLVYINDCEVEQEENQERDTVKTEEVIGGDLSAFEVSTGVYYLSRRDFFKRATPEVIKSWVGDSIPYKELQGWRKSYQPGGLFISSMQLYIVPELLRDTLYKRIWVGYFNMESDLSEIKKAVSRLAGVDFVCATKARFSYTDKKNLFVLGRVDSLTVETCVKEFEKTISVIDVTYNVHRPFKLYFTKIRGKIPEELHSLIVKIFTKTEKTGLYLE
ncbi:disease resistance protein RUN1-like, partial [Bidens hawaiensis]|uniref:disease resistance protein RUN1-like n=1 Tax=Bidens hawaiensis TaxID=980011 RepID=UPI0040493325